MPTPKTIKSTSAMPSVAPSLVRSWAAEYLTFIAATGDQPHAVEMRYEDENIWLTQKMMATLYEVSVPAVNQHLKRIFADRELEEDSVIKHYLITAADEKGYQVKHYSLQAIVAVGFKIENERAVQFRNNEPIHSSFPRRRESTSSFPISFFIETHHMDSRFRGNDALSYYV